MGVVTSNIQLFKTLGQTIAPSVLGTVLSQHLKGQVEPAVPDAVHGIFRICIAIAALSLIISFLMKEIPLTDHQQGAGAS